jgi:hypothetical protein
LISLSSVGPSLRTTRLGSALKRSANAAAQSPELERAIAGAANRSHEPAGPIEEDHPSVAGVANGDAAVFGTDRSSHSVEQRVVGARGGADAKPRRGTKIEPWDQRNRPIDLGPAQRGLRTLLRRQGRYSRCSCSRRKPCLAPPWRILGHQSTARPT